MDKFFKKACEEIDAGIFSGDAILNQGSLEEFKYYLGRWERQLKPAQSVINEVKEESIVEVVKYTAKQIKENYIYDFGFGIHQYECNKCMSRKVLCVMTGAFSPSRKVCMMCDNIMLAPKTEDVILFEEVEE